MGKHEQQWIGQMKMHEKPALAVDAVYKKINVPIRFETAAKTQVDLLISGTEASIRAALAQIPLHTKAMAYVFPPQHNVSDGWTRVQANIPDEGAILDAVDKLRVVPYFTSRHMKIEEVYPAILYLTIITANTAERREEIRKKIEALNFRLTDRFPPQVNRPEDQPYNVEKRV